MAREPIDLIERGYHLDLGEETWLRELMIAAPWLDRGLGLTAYTYRIAGHRLEIDAFAMTNATPEMEAAARAMNDAPPWEGIVRAYLDTCFASLKEAIGAANDAALVDRVSHGLPPGVVDVLGLVAHDASGDGVVLAAPSASPLVVKPAQVPRARRIAAHLAAALRLRRALSERRSPVDAVLEPNGRLLHAEGDAREAAARAALTAAVRARDEARAQARRGATDAIAGWTPRVEARWSLVDAEESDGKALVLAHVNELEIPEPSGLAPRERQVAICAALGWSNKLIAYTLGVSESSVASSLGSARRKLGYDSRVALAGGLQRLATAPPLRERSDRELLHLLTPAEHDVLELVMRGATNAEIGRARGRAERTVANQVASLLRKLEAGSRTELAAQLRAR
ncbi:MAG: helix-turn-helix transcriptional regulator [Sandaracinus sp.]